MDIAQDGNLFPREDILEAVAQSDWRDQAVPAGAWWLSAFGLTLLALGMPILDPLAMEPTTFAAAGDHLWRHPIHALAAVGGKLGVGIESSWYILSALAMGLSFVLLGGALRVIGIGPRLALVVSLLTTLSPLVLSHGRLPSDFTAGVLGSCVALAGAFASSDPGRAGSRGYGVRLALALLVATLLHPLNALLGVPLLFAARARGGSVAVAPVAAISLLALACLPDVTEASASQVLGGADFYLGCGPLLLLIVLAWTGAREESPPPVWLTLWLAVGLTASLVTALQGNGPAAPMLAPVVAALAASALSRFARPDNTTRVAGVAALLTVALAAMAPWLRSPAGAQGLANAAPILFQPDDTVFASDGALDSAAAYLVRRRFGVTVEVLTTTPKGAGQGRIIGLAPNAAGLPWTLDAEAGTIQRHE